MNYLLHIDTATSVCSVCLSRDGEAWIIRESADGQAHAGNITLFIEDVLQTANITLQDLAAVSVSLGPGSYTGLRIGISTAKGICYALQKPLIVVPTLKTLAWAMRQSVDADSNMVFAPMLDARRMDAYTTVYDMNLNELQPVDCLTLAPDTFARYTDAGLSVLLGGDAVAKYAQTGKAVASDVRANSARYLCALAYEDFCAKRFADVAYIEPFYLKPPAATTPKPTI